MWDCVPDVLQSTTSLNSPSAVVHVGTFYTFYINKGVLHLVGLCLIWLKVTISSLGPGSNAP